jgi:serine/threonine-protein kinase
MKFDDESCLKIFDFGSSRLEGAEATTANIVVTPGFGAPELFVAGPAGKIDFSQAIDVYAFGATALFFAFGDLPADLKQLPPNLPAAAADFSLATQGLPDDIVTLLNACLEAMPANRPSMAEIRDALARQLLTDRHRALLVSGGESYILDSSNRVVNLSAQGLGALRISYDGQRFVVSNVSGHVSVNNMMVVDDNTIAGSCVIILDHFERGMRRVFITFDVAHPEVTL